MKTIDLFPGVAREQQEICCDEFDKYLDYPVTMVVGPVAVGKSHAAVAMARRLNAEGMSVGIVTPTNIQVGQYARDFPELAVIQRRNLYSSTRQFEMAREAARRAAISLSTYYGYASNRFKKDAIILDEAHNVISMIQDQWCKTLWQSKYLFPDDLDTVGDVVQWMEESQFKKQLNTIRKEILCDRSYTVRFEEGLLRGKKEKCLKLIPLSIKDRRPWLWKYQTKKIILMSATINYQDLKELGLDRRRWHIIDLDSPIPPANRLVHYEPLVNMSFKLRHFSVDKLVDRLMLDLETEPGKGVIHCTYDTASRLRFKMKHPRLIWHEKGSDQKFKEFLKSPIDDARVFVASGFNEGVDLKYDLCRWQVLTEVPFLDMKDPAVAYKAYVDPKWYAWQAIKVIIQTVGRICRTPWDKGKTKIYDKQFGRLLSQYNDLWPLHFLTSVVDRGSQ